MMRTSLFAALMAAASLIPGAAMAQRGADGRGDFERGRGAITAEAQADIGQARGDAGPRGNGGSRGDRGPRADGGPRADRGDDGRRGGGGFGGSGAAQPAPAPVAQVDRGDRGGFRGNDGRGPDNRGDGGQWRRNDPRGGDAQARVDNRGSQWRGNDDRGGNQQWRGNDRRGDQGRFDDARGNQGRGDQWRGNDRRADFRGNQGNWNRGWRQDNRYDWNRRRQYNRNAFHLPRYYAPSGWGYGYRRFNVGITLNSGLFNRNYWIDDAYDYGLPEAYGPYRWVRYYNDALLVDVYSGRVVDTVYDIFW